MKIIEAIGFGIFVVLCALGILFLRREIISRGRGTIELNLRLSTMMPDRGWSPGIARFIGDDMRWYRVFSLSIRPRRTLSRRALSVDQRRQPTAAEHLVLPADWIVLRCTSQRASVEIAMAETTLTGFLSWLEAAPPGAASMRFAAR
ncbi:MAG: hypothetical protein AUI14_13760 [Actinobacteria bacterium 13_2_20CM_2_71_6]|nr:MAG: hypothetical protein AUI14_13760 [Actinobacteria bacterium 13_2_20CM_2_71_6]